LNNFQPPGLPRKRRPDLGGIIFFVSDKIQLTFQPVTALLKLDEIFKLPG
jgi:hypothetical protein